MAKPDDAGDAANRADRGGDNFPGFEYFQRISAATFRALAAHGEEMNGAWSEIRRGRYDVPMAIQGFAKVFENYYGIFTELMRGPSQVARPAWLVVPYSKRKPPAPSFSVPIEGVIPPGMPLDYTKFESFGWDERPVFGIYARPPEVSGSRVEIRLNDDVIQRIPDDTDLVSFIFRKSMGSAPPLVIVLLHVGP